MFVNFKAISLVLTLNVIVGGTYLFAQNTVAESKAVYETRTVFGHDVTGIIFELNDADPNIVDSVTFHVAPGNGSAPARQVKIQTRPEGAWTECSLVDDVLPARAATCTFESLAVDDVIALNIVAR